MNQLNARKDLTSRGGIERDKYRNCRKKGKEREERERDRALLHPDRMSCSAINMFVKKYSAVGWCSVVAGRKLGR